MKVSITGMIVALFLVNGMDAQNLEQSTKITLEARAESDQFGSAVCIEDNQLFVGATGEKEDENGENPLEKAGAVFFYKKQQEGNWTNTQKLVADDREEGDHFGYDIDRSSDFLIIGADKHAKDETGTNSKTSAGAVYVFKQTGPGTWEKIQKFVASDRAENDRFGASV